MPIALVGLAASAASAAMQAKQQRKAQKEQETMLANGGYVGPDGAAMPYGGAPPVQTVNQNVTVQASSAGASMGPTGSTSVIPSYNPNAPYYPNYGYRNPEMPYVPPSSATGSMRVMEANLMSSMPLILIVGAIATVYALMSQPQRA